MISKRGSSIKLISGETVDVYVYWGNKLYKLELTVLDTYTYFQPLLGRDWLDIIINDWRNIFIDNKYNEMIVNLSDSELITNKYKVLNKFETIFSKCNVLKAEACSIFAKQRQFPME